MIASPTYLLVRKMIERGNQPGLIQELMETSAKWAEANGNTADGAALRTWLGMVNFKRPFYCAAELAFFWPALKLACGYEKKLVEPPSANRLANELKFHGLPIVLRADIIGDWFPKNSIATEYFIVESIGKWRDVRLTVEEFENVLNDR